MIYRRIFFQPDPPVDLCGALAEIRRLMNWSQAAVAWHLNVPRSTLDSWEDGCRPDVDNGLAVLKLLKTCRDFVTSEERMRV